MRRWTCGRLERRHGGIAEPVATGPRHRPDPGRDAARSAVVAGQLADPRPVGRRGEGQLDAVRSLAAGPAWRGSAQSASGSFGAAARLDPAGGDLAGVGERHPVRRGSPIPYPWRSGCPRLGGSAMAGAQGRPHPRRQHPQHATGRAAGPHAQQPGHGPDAGPEVPASRHGGGAGARLEQAGDSRSLSESRQFSRRAAGSGRQRPGAVRQVSIRPERKRVDLARGLAAGAECGRRTAATPGLRHRRDRRLSQRLFKSVRAGRRHAGSTTGGATDRRQPGAAPGPSISDQTGPATRNHARCALAAAGEGNPCSAIGGIAGTQCS